tara:strand:- start:5035 stop:7191 length:2157 start_codon:yes stop_codon:yes gene_type:complete
MAEKKESIEISYKANMSDLIKKLESMPNVTSKEAKKMVGALDRQLKQAENAAKRSSNASKKAMKASSAAAKKGAKDFKKLASSASMVSVSVLAMGAGVIGFTQKIADLTNELTDANAKTGIAVETLAGLRLAAEGSGLEFSNLEGGLVRFQKSMVDSENGTKKLEDAFGTLGVKVKDSDGNFRKTNDTFNDVMKSLSQMESGAERNALAMEIFGKSAGPGLIQSGALDNLESMTELAKEFGVAIDEQAIASMARFQRSMATFDMAFQGTLSKLMEALAGKNSMSMGIDAASESMIWFGSVASDALALAGQQAENLIGTMTIAAVAFSGVGSPLQRLDTALSITKDLVIETVIAKSNYDHMFTRANEAVIKFNSLSAETKKTQEESAVILKEQLETEEQKAKREKASAAAAKAKAKAEKEALEALKLQMKIIKGNQTLTEKIQDSLISNYDMFASEHEKELSRIAEKENRQQMQISRNLASEIEAINELEKLTGETIEAVMARGLAEEDAADASLEASVERIKAEAELKSKLAEEELTRKAEAHAKEIQYGMDLAKSAMVIASARIDFIEENAEANEAAAQKVFRLKQMEAVGRIAISTAEGVMAALGAYPGPPGMLLASGVAAAGVIQMATVHAQTPPSFHMGGLNPDEGNARILKGEAVLDRETVRRIGGESGVKNLQQGGESESGSVVIIQPFKHFGRFAKEIGYKKPRRTGIRSY